MKNYELNPEEVVLYKENVEEVDSKGELQLILTNQHIVFIKTNKKLFGKDEVIVEDYPVNEIKMYNNLPHFKVKGTVAEIYLLSTDKEIKFASKSELHDFINTANRLLTKKTKVERCAEKIKNTINLIDDTLGVKTVESVTNAVKDGGLVTATKGVGKVVKAVGGMFKKKDKQKQITDKIEN